MKNKPEGHDPPKTLQEAAWEQLALLSPKQIAGLPTRKLRELAIRSSQMEKGVNIE
jgi:hypothetical protein